MGCDSIDAIRKDGREVNEVVSCLRIVRKSDFGFTTGRNRRNLRSCSIRSGSIRSIGSNDHLDGSKVITHQDTHLNLGGCRRIVNHFNIPHICGNINQRGAREYNL